MKNSKPVLDPELANMKGPEDKTAMLIIFANSENDAMEALHAEIGHATFVS